MAFLSEIVPFTLRSGAGSQTVSHIQQPSLQAKGVIFYTTISGGFFPCHFFTMGLDDSVTHVACGTTVGRIPAFGWFASARAFSSHSYSLLYTEPLVAFGGSQAVVGGYVTAFNTGSFDITFDFNSAGGTQCFAILLYGSGLLCVVKSHNVQSGDDTVDVGFDPIAIIRFPTPVTSEAGNLAGGVYTLGFGVPCGPNQVSMGIFSNSLDPDCRTRCYQKTGLIGGEADPAVAAGGAVIRPQSISSYPSNGFNLTFETPIEGYDLGYMALGGTDISANLVSFNQPSSTGVQNVAITATNPKLVLFGSVNKPTSTLVQSDLNMSFGAYDGTNNDSVWIGAVNGAASPFQEHQRQSTTKAITLATATGVGTSTVNAEASISLASQNIAVNWTTADATAREVWALVLAQNLTGSTNICGANPQASITVIKQTTPIPGGLTQFPFSTTGGLSPSSFTLLSGQSQLFSGLSSGTYGVTEAAPDGWSVSYVVSDSSPHDAIVLGTGEAVTVTVTNTFQSTNAIFRRLRRWSLPQDENFQMFISRLEIIAAMGVGNTDAPDPVIRLRISRDGGNTWGAFQTMTIGAAAQYTKRAYLTRQGRGRNLVAELICDDPVFVAWVQATVQATKGTS